MTDPDFNRRALTMSRSRQQDRANAPFVRYDAARKALAEAHRVDGRSPSGSRRGDVS
jgi:hypothetical protein